MPTNNFLPFASAASSNVWSDATYAGSSQQQTGIQKGIVPSGLMSKAWRQSAAGSAVMGQIITAYGLVDAVDDGNIAGLAANYRMALAAMLAGAPFAIDQSATANVVQASIDPVPPGLSTFRGVFIRIANTNTGTATFALNNLGAKNIVKKNGSPLAAGDLVAGQFAHLIYDLTAGQWAIAGMSLSDFPPILSALNITGNTIKTFAASTSWTVPAGVTRIRVIVRGAGGGGGGSSGQGSAGSAGARGGYGEGTYAVTPGQIIPITVGVGGTGANPANSTAGQPGGTSSVGSFITVTGGGFGGSGINGIYSGAFAQGGVSSGGQLEFQGGIGGYGSGLGGSSPGTGGACQGDYGGPPGTVAGSQGAPGTFPGGGGGGGANGFSGGVGGNAFVIVMY